MDTQLYVFSCRLWHSDRPKPVSTVPIFTRSVSILGDCLLLIITWMKTAYLRKVSIELKHFKPKLSQLLYRDGEILLILSASCVSRFVALGTWYFLYV